MSYTLIRSSRRTIAIQINAEKGVVIRAPRLVSERRIEKFLKEKEDWVQKHLQKIEHNRANTKKNKFEPGEKFPLLGKEIIPPVHTKEFLTKWYRDKALHYLTKRTKELAKQNVLTPTKIQIRSYRARWGTCSAKNVLTYNWRIIMAPPEVVDYLICHELAHIKHKNHGKHFYKLLSEIHPTYKTDRKYLRENGHMLML
ncbi:M48 family metallopeptidase [Candidatus Peregrinibacteria bacterium]|jgi:predicted metal-dependent hydrolase|nr:M48 family metallopeptidase [Candidatus Peregrinibacteria bacterium]MBT4055958.1 M48 family metallopeptidase [Candidatus Peregrinibacteria bacterium]